MNHFILLAKIPNLKYPLGIFSLSLATLIYITQIFSPDRDLRVSFVLSIISAVLARKLSRVKYSASLFVEDSFTFLTLIAVFHSAVWFFKSKYGIHTAGHALQAIQFITTFLFFYLKHKLTLPQHLISLLLFTLIPPFSLLQNLNIGIFTYLIILLALLLSVYASGEKIYFDGIPAYIFIFMILGAAALPFTFSITNTLHHILVMLIFAVVFLSARFASDADILSRLLFPAFLFSLLFSFYIFAEKFSGFKAATGEFNVNLIAMSLVYTFFILLFYFFHHKSNAFRLITASLMILVFIEMFQLESRTAIAAILISLLSMTVLFYAQKTRFRPLIKFTPFIYLISLAVLFLWITVLLGRDNSVAQRIILYKQSLSGILENPVYFFTGTGDYGPYSLFRHESAFGEYPKRLMDENILLTHPHSDYISLLYGSGIFGFFLFIIIVYSVLKRNFDSKHLSKLELVIISCVYAVLIEGLLEPMATQLITGGIFWFFLGVLWAANIKNTKSDLQKSRSWKNIQIILIFAVTVITAYLFVQRIAIQNIFKPVNKLWSSVIFPKNPVDSVTMQSFLQMENRLNIYRIFYPHSPGSDYIYGRTLKELLALPGIPEELNSSDRKNLADKVVLHYCRAFSRDKNPLYCDELTEFLIQENVPDQFNACGISFQDFQKECAGLNSFKGLFKRKK